MYLKKISLQGFKSFARKTVLEFGPGITVIVGPNGSGKSNVSDAVKWVLGEQSMKNLRSKKSEDVIFVGSGKKSKAGMAEVSLELDNKEKVVPIDYTEVDITRRIYRSGEGEYLLNNSKVRLLDITEILSKSGFGRSTYTVIGQGMVDQLITQTPDQRRELFEDASGVKHFYIKKEQALKKFDEARENLLRVLDIIKEIRPRLLNLERQRQEAEERRTLSRELRKLQQKYYGSELKELNEKLDEYDKKYKEISREIEKVESEVEEITKKLEDRTSGADKQKEAEKEAGILKLEQELGNLQDSLLKTIRENAAVLEKQKFYDENLGSLKNESEGIKKQEQEKQKEIENIQKEKQNLEEELEKSLSLLNSLEEDSKKIQTLNPKEVIIKVKKSLEGILEEIGQLLSNPEQLESEISELVKFLEEQEKEDFKDIERKKLDISGKIEKIKLKISSNNYKQKNSEEILKIYQNKADEILQKIKEGEKQEPVFHEDSKRQKIEERIKKLKAKKEEEREALEEIKKKNQAQEGEFFEIEKSYRVKRDILADFKEELTKIEIDMARLKTKKENLRNDIQENLKSENELEFISISEEQKSEIFERIIGLKRKLESLGGVVNIDDDKEYKEVKERYDFLTTQSEDLKKAISGSKKVVLELERKIHNQFRDRFEKISEKFNFHFQKLFGGGAAKLILKQEETDSNNNESSQGNFIIDIQAVPPGKRVHTLNTLSGGEKSLTSIALLFAIFSVNPTPFCVLDEVDAALDESNSLRFAELLSELASNTQFIVVTHNRETMKQAKVLYGVTMDEAKISKVLSLKLEEAEKYSE